MEYNVHIKVGGAVKSKRCEEFSGDPASDLGKFKRSELESMLGCDKGSPIMIRVK